MVDFLTSEWIAESNERLARADVGPSGLAPNETVHVVLELVDAPARLAHAITFTITDSGARVAAGDHLGAELVVRLSYVDARSLSEGELDASRALRDGRLKVRGDINALVPLGAWMAAAHRDVT